MAGHPWEIGEIDPDSGDVGGDHQASNAVSRRFAQQIDEKEFLVYTVYGYASLTHEMLTRHEGGEEDVVWDVTAQTEIMRCSDWQDPGSTEITCDYEYNDDVYAIGYDTEQQAYDNAAAHIKSIDMLRDLAWEPVQ
jgi:hypothetical protein